MATAQDLIADARKFAGGVVDNAKDAMDDALTMVKAVGYVAPNPKEVTLPIAPPDSVDLTPPDHAAVDFQVPTEPGNAPSYQTMPAVDIGNAPVLTANAPTLVAPNKPTPLASFNEAPPVIDTDLVFPEIPAALTNPMVEAPVIVDRAMPEKPQILLPVFDKAAPVDTTVAPTDLDGQFDRAYRGASTQMVADIGGQVDAWVSKVCPQFNTQMARWENRIAALIDNGNALPASIEDQLYERDRDKISAEARRVRDAAMEDFADLGHTLPPGALFAATVAAEQAGADNLARSSSTIAIEQAQRERETLQMALTMSMTMRSTVIGASLNYMGNLSTINGQAIQYASRVLDAVIETYNTAIKASTLRLDTWKAEGAIYEIRLKGALSLIELYKAELQALETMTNVDKAKVDVYRARIDSLGAYAKLHETLIQAVLGKATLEAKKLDVFQAKVQAFTATVQAKNSEWQGYTAQWNGEDSKVRLYGSEVQAYSAQNVAFKAVAEAKTEQVRSIALSNKALGDQYGQELEAFRAVVGARGDVARIQLENQRQDIIAFQAENQAKEADARLRLGFYEATARVAMQNADLNFRAQIEEARSTREFGDAISKLGIALAQIFSAQASAAMSGMNSLVTQQKQE